MGLRHLLADVADDEVVVGPGVRGWSPAFGWHVAVPGGRVVVAVDRVKVLPPAGHHGARMRS
jgi:hypothetical protein